MLTIISTFLVFGFVGIAALGHVLVFTAAVFGNSVRPASAAIAQASNAQPAAFAA